jgi:hypothetical protein
MLSLRRWLPERAPGERNLHGPVADDVQVDIAVDACPLGVDCQRGEVGRTDLESVGLGEGRCRQPDLALFLVGHGAVVPAVERPERRGSPDTYVARPEAT